MANVAGGGSSPLLQWIEDGSGNCFLYAKVHDGNADSKFIKGRAGILLARYNAVGDAESVLVWVAENDFPNDLKGVLPAVLSQDAAVGDVVKVQVYGIVDATFESAIDTSSNKNLQIPNAGGELDAISASARDWNMVWGISRDSRTGASHSVFLPGNWLAE